jgi:hypothetical protein
MAPENSMMSRVDVYTKPFTKTERIRHRTRQLNHELMHNGNTEVRINQGGVDIRREIVNEMTHTP